MPRTSEVMVGVPRIIAESGKPDGLLHRCLDDALIVGRIVVLVWEEHVNCHRGELHRRSVSQARFIR